MAEESMALNDAVPDNTWESGTTPTMDQAAGNNQYIDVDNMKLVQFEEPVAGDQIAVLTTSMGEIRVRLFPQYAPKAVENFVTLAEEGFYNNKPVHHVQDDYLIQSGAVNSNGTGSRSIYKNEAGEQVPYEDEFSMDLWHFRGALACMNPETPDQNGSQFFIVQTKNIRGATEQQMSAAQVPSRVIEKYKEVGGVPYMDWNYTIFGMVTQGMDVVDAIAAVEVDEIGTPVTPVIIESVVIETVE